MKNAGLEAENIHTFSEVASGSAIVLNQFLLLEVLWTSKATNEDLFESKGNLTGIRQDNYQKAVNDLRRAPFWRSYLESFKLPGLDALASRPFPDLGSMTQVRYYQLLCRTVAETEDSTPKYTPIKTRAKTSKARVQESPQSPTRVSEDVGEMSDYMGDLTVEDEYIYPETPEQKSHIFTFDSPESWEAFFPPTEDEQIVNAALLLFLNAITLHFKISAKWSLHRKAFRFGNDNNKIFEARVDGYLLCTADSRIKAIVEVKPYLRSGKSKDIKMQEAAQMTAWISSDPDPMGDPRKTLWQVIHPSSFIKAQSF